MMSSDSDIDRQNAVLGACIPLSTEGPKVHYQTHNFHKNNTLFFQKKHKSRISLDRTATLYLRIFFMCRSEVVLNSRRKAKLIEVKELVKRYGNHTAVDHLNFHVEKGQIYGFLGPNGAGKSTTMNLLTGYLPATEGQILIHGYDIGKKPQEAKGCIGYLPELPPLYLDMTVMEYLCFVAELKSVERKEIKTMLEKIMEQTQIFDVKERLIRHLSKGYRQRVGLAQALVGEPEVLILDEPMVGLDPKQIIEIRELIKSLGTEHTIILSSHILSEITSICDHVMIISHGKLVASDTPENLGKYMTRSNMSELRVRGTLEACEKAIELLKSIEGLDVKTSAASLEDIFLELTSEEFSDTEEQDIKKDSEESENGEE